MYTHKGGEQNYCSKHLVRHISELKKGGGSGLLDFTKVSAKYLGHLVPGGDTWVI